MTKRKVRTELQLQKVRYKRQLEFCKKKIDNEMENLIKRSFNEKKTIILQKQWTKQCEIRNLKFVQELSMKEQWFKKMWMSMSKPQPRGATHRNKQENSIQERIYSRNDYKKDKNNGKKNYRSNTGHGGEH